MMDDFYKKQKKFSSFDLLWVIAMFGTAVGAGILFLPIRAGIGGFYPAIVMVFFSLPMVYLAHRCLARYINSSKKIKDVIEVSEDSFGNVMGSVIALLYVFVFYPVCLAYGVGITNTAYNFIVNQLHITNIPRVFVAFVIITPMVYGVIKNRAFMLRFTSLLVFPLIVVLFCFSLYLIPQWNLETLAPSYIPSFKNFILVLLVSVPILVFSFNHSPAISPFVMDIRKKYPDQNIADKKINMILFSSATIIVGFCMFFVISVTLTLTPSQLQEAQAQNVSILSYLSNTSMGGNNIIVGYLAPFIAFLAIFSSFFGHYLAHQEGSKNLIIKQFKLNKNKHEKIVGNSITIFTYITMIIVATLNPSILSFIESLGAPIIATLLFLMPLYGVYKIPALKKYRKNISNLFLLIMGLLAVSGISYKLIMSLIEAIR